MTPTFRGGFNDLDPSGALVFGPDGRLYGTAQGTTVEVGAYPGAPQGAVFAFDPVGNNYSIFRK